MKALFASLNILSLWIGTADATGQDTGTTSLKSFGNFARSVGRIDNSSLQTRRRVVSLNNVRWFVAFCIFLLVRPAVFSQDQEGKLVDRLLRPNTELQNTAQNKKFIADGRSINKQATVGTFYVQKRSNSKEYAGRRDFSAWQFNAQSFRSDRWQANASSPNQMVNSHTSYSTRTATGLRAAHDAKRTAAGRNFSGKRPFLDEGKSQKTLSAHSRPLTIEEVRELLNKNK